MSKLKQWMEDRMIVEVEEDDETVIIYLDDGHSIAIGPHPQGYAFVLDPYENMESVEYAGLH